MSFLEEREPPPRRSSSRPRRRTPAGPAGGGSEVWTRRAVAIGVVLVVLLALTFLVRSCRDSRRESAFTDYTRESSGLVEESSQLSRSLFDLLRDPGGQSAVELESTMNGLAVQAEQLLDRAGSIDTPDQLAEQQGSLVQTMELRRDGVRGVARQLPPALGDDGREEAARRMAGEMRTFLASDVIYERRFVPGLEAALEESAPQARSSIADGPFLPDVGWIVPGTVATRISRIREGGQNDRAASPGLHGTALGTVTATPTGTALNEGAPVALGAAEGLGFDVEVQNQGENDERITVRLSVAARAEGEGPIDLKQDLESPLPAGQSDTVSIPLAQAPPSGPATVEVEVVPVPGEKKRDNNKGTFPVSFGG